MVIPDVLSTEQVAAMRRELDRLPTTPTAALTTPSDFAFSINLRAYATPESRPFGIAIACGSMPGRPSRTREPGN